VSSHTSTLSAVQKVHSHARVLASEMRFQMHFQFSAQKCARKVRFYKSCTSAASESGFDQANRILRLKVGVLIYTVSRLSKCQGYIDRFLILWSLHGSIRCCETDRETDCTTFLSLDTQDVERRQLRCTQNSRIFNCAHLFT